MHFKARLVLAAILLFSAHAIFAQKPLLIDHTVSLHDTAAQQFHISTTIKNIKQDRLDLSLPTWAPGWYTVENYFKNVLRFRITDASGKVMPMRMIRKQTWELDTKGVGEIHVDYDYHSSILALNQAKIARDYAFFQGIELFLEPVGHRDDPATVHFSIPSGWKLISALKETSDPMVFTADDYDALVDAPTEMGSFDMTKFEVEGKPHYLVTTPVGAFSQANADAFTPMLSKIAMTDSRMFGGLPYEKYVYFYFFDPPESNASGALEHLNAFVAFAPLGASPDRLQGTAAHEYFHLWNVKRIRPAEMWPYDYSRENETPLLWVSEGFTNYYGNRAQYRSGLRTKEQFYDTVATAIRQNEGTEVRNYVSPANSSVSTWVGYDSPVAFGISYYTQGQNLAALLDLSIRNDTDGASSLDDVMRALYNDNYKKGRGFTTEEMISIIKRITKRDYHDFYDRYVWGTDVPNYDQIFGYAGIKVERTTVQDPDLGFSAKFRNGGLFVNGIQPNTGAAASSLKVGDVITKIDGTSIASAVAQLGSMAGKTVTLTVSRGDEEQTMPLKIGSVSSTAYKLVEDSSATAKQLKVRQSWLDRPQL